MAALCTATRASGKTLLAVPQSGESIRTQSNSRNDASTSRSAPAHVGDYRSASETF
ncbi:hypothetical protein [Haladaptatus sp. DYF46]|uniref:hypothetical protein n=1 Tax=Haladaptatus sp. DYF46 TaxID=2886041 RepID=UPI001E37CD9C|nr:hypothetical protein [Haladaptatus sp. DYF46]